MDVLFPCDSDDVDLSRAQVDRPLAVLRPWDPSLDWPSSLAASSEVERHPSLQIVRN